MVRAEFDSNRDSNARGLTVTATDGGGLTSPEIQRYWTSRDSLRRPRHG